MKPSRYLIFISMGFELVGLVLGSVYLGQVLDNKFGTKGILLLVLTLACLASWLVHLIFLLKRIERSEALEEERNKRG